MTRKLSEDEIALWRAYTTGESLGGAMILSDASALLRPSRRSQITSLDLHGLTIAAAHKAVLAFLEEATRTHKSVTVITGLSGEIRREFPMWLETLASVSKIEEMNGGGAFKIRFKRQKKNV